MKLTWFGGTTLRIHYGGEVLIVDPSGAPQGVDPAELAAGADRVFALDHAESFPQSVDPAAWRRRRPVSLLDEAKPEVTASRLGTSTLLFESADEPVLLVITGEAPPFGRWADETVIALLGGKDLPAMCTTVLDVARPRLLAVAAADDVVEAVVIAVRERLDGVAFAALEPGLALEA